MSELPIKVKVQESANQVVYTDAVLINGSHSYVIPANPGLVLDFYNMRRRDVGKAAPNAAHIGLAELEKDFDVHIITQNIDDLHERAGSTRVLHLHGEIFKMRSESDESLVYDIREDILLGQLADDGAQLRQHGAAEVFG